MNQNERMSEEIARRRATPRSARAWAKCEIFLGLTAASVGLLCGVFLLSRPSGDVPWAQVAGDVVLMVLGGYLALAGQRSHLYQSSFEQTAFLLDEIRAARSASLKGDSSYEHPR